MREFHIERLIIGVCGDPPSSAGFQGAALVARIFDAGLSALVLADDTAKTLRGLSSRGSINQIRSAGSISAWSTCSAIMTGYSCVRAGPLQKLPVMQALAMLLMCGKAL
ncbi:MAG: hypothetical protein FJX29_12710 [Alphaproteobacteria bacterium]|nr:hypothetical protein [Alphaproteobacteria bacterium]